MDALVYAIRCIIMLLVTWLGLRIVGKKSIAQLTSYDLAGILLLTTVAAEPLVYKIPSKAAEGVLVIAVCLFLLGMLTLNKRFYNADNKPSIVIANGKLNKDELRKNQMNIPFLLSQLRLQKIAKVSEVEFAIIEPNGNLSVLPKSQERAVKPKDMGIATKYEGLALPLIIDGEIQYRNLSYANLKPQWLNDQLNNTGIKKIEDVLLAELDSEGQLYLNTYGDNPQQYIPPIY